MKDIISINNIMSIKSIDNTELEAICKVNKDIYEYGITISKQDAKEMIITKKESLKKNGRVEFKGSIINEIIKKFVSSPYIYKSNYKDIFCELIEIFYEYKNETMEVIGDEELIDAMASYFNNYCHGSLELLEGKVLYKIAENVRMGNNNPLDIFDNKDEEDDYF